MLLALKEGKPRTRGTRAGCKRQSDVSCNAVGIDEGDKRAWILESGSSRHLVRDASLLRDAKSCIHEIKRANGNALELTQLGSVRLRVMYEGVECVVTLTDVFLAPQLSCNILSFGKLKQKGFNSSYSSGAQSLVRRSEGAVAIDVTTKTTCSLSSLRRAKGVLDVIMTVLTADNAALDPARDVQVKSLIHFFQRLGYKSSTRLSLSHATRTRSSSSPTVVALNS
ncbi:unnamed protein product [Peronospora effusa]|nr:unnamed protein product [Peronospora effusa]